jgi:hypothetical protein
MFSNKKNKPMSENEFNKELESITLSKDESIVFDNLDLIQSALNVDFLSDTDIKGLNLIVELLAEDMYRISINRLKNKVSSNLFHQISNSQYFKDSTINNFKSDLKRKIGNGELKEMNSDEKKEFIYFTIIAIGESAHTIPRGLL